MMNAAVAHDEAPKRSNKVAQKSTGPSAFGFHRIASFMECPQKYAYRWEACLVPEYEGSATGRGTAVHEALRAHYMDEDPFDAIDALPSRFGPVAAQAKEIFKDYKKYYRGAKDKVLAVEKEYEVTVGGRRFTRRIDLVVERRGCVCIMDHKTAAQPKKRANNAELEWSLATQELVGRALLPAATFRPWGGVILNIIPTCGTDDFLRVPISFPRRILECIPKSLSYYLDRIAELHDVNIYDYPKTGKCVGTYGKCEYLDLCTGGAQYRSRYIAEVAKG